MILNDTIKCQNKKYFKSPLLFWKWPKSSLWLSLKGADSIYFRVLFWWRDWILLQNWALLLSFLNSCILLFSKNHTCKKIHYVWSRSFSFIFFLLLLLKLSSRLFFFFLFDDLQEIFDDLSVFILNFNLLLNGIDLVSFDHFLFS